MLFYCPIGDMFLKLVVFNDHKLGCLLEDGSVVDLKQAYKAMLKSNNPSQIEDETNFRIPSKLVAFIKTGEKGLFAAKQAVEYVKEGNKKSMSGEKLQYKNEDVKLHAPLPSLASRLIMAGANFYDHTAGMYSNMGNPVTIEDLKKQVAEGNYAPWGFYKHARAVIGPSENIIYPSKTDRLDYEVEVGAVFGKKGKDIPEEEAMDYIYGYTIVLDMSCRSTVGGSGRRGGGRGPSNELVSGKRFDTSAPMGPCLVTADEVGDPNELKLGLNVNGEVRQNGRMSDMIRGFPFWINHVTKDLTLYPGDIVCGGTCAGTAADMTPRGPDRKQAPDLFLKPGDKIEAWVDKIGTLKNQIIAK